MQIFLLDLTVQNLLFIVRVALYRLFFYVTDTIDPSSEPFLSGDTFRSLASHVYDEHDSFDPNEVGEKDIVFVGFHYLEQFFSIIHPQISAHYVLITHNGDMTIDETKVKYIDDKIIHWFSQNVNVVHKKLTPIPIGLENLDYYNHGVPSFYKNEIRHKSKKIMRILFGFSVHTNPIERQKAYNYIASHLQSSAIKNRLNGYAYLQEMSKYAFVLSPPGNGIDCLRTWEAMYFGCIPIVLKSVMTNYFKKIGLPMLVVDSWDELNGYTSDKLRDTYNHIMKKQTIEPLYLKYWQKKIAIYAK